MCAFARPAGVALSRPAKMEAKVGNAARRQCASRIISSSSNGAVRSIIRYVVEIFVLNNAGAMAPSGSVSHCALWPLVRTRAPAFRFRTLMPLSACQSASHTGVAPPGARGTEMAQKHRPSALSTQMARHCQHSTAHRGS